MDYETTNSIISNFMDSSGIRLFCRSACEGTCCCERKENCCEPRGCDDKLECVAYVCDVLRCAIRRIAPDADRALSAWDSYVKQMILIKNEIGDGPLFKSMLMQIDVGEALVISGKDIRAISNMLAVVKPVVEMAKYEFNILSGTIGCSGFAILEYAFEGYFGVGAYAGSLQEEAAAEEDDGTDTDCIVFGKAIVENVTLIAGAGTVHVEVRHAA